MKKELLALLECFDFKFSGTEDDEEMSQLLVFDTLRAVARESVKDKALDSVEFRTAVFVGSKIMSSATYHPATFSKEKKSNCEYDAVRKFMVHIHVIELNSSLDSRRRRMFCRQGCIHNGIF